ncbi:hypothetical protein Tco_1080159 [Tanacetum coccineum]|uniref:Synaptobrevin, longin-like domain protein n=1 Tax=Tanacetum coccineum TaxID=301880 RepID=A0ABQ5HU69_9ASTR
MVAFLEKSTGSEGFHQVIDFLNRSHICYALTKKPDVYISFIKQFWRSAEATNDDNGEVQITATIDGHSMTITEASLRRHLKLDDHDGITSIPNSEIFEQLALMGYHTDSDKLTFQKGAFSPQWRFLIHTILHCLSPKKTAWEQFSSNIATAVICLATNRRYNFSRKQLQQHSRTYPVPSLSIKVFNNMKRPTKGYSGQEVALFPTMLQATEPSTSPLRTTSSPSPSSEPTPDHITAVEPLPSPTQQTQPSPDIEQHVTPPHDSPLHAVYLHGSDEGNLKLTELMNLVNKFFARIEVLEDDLKKTKQLYSSTFSKLILMVKKLETQVKTRKARRKARIVHSDDEDIADDSSKQGRKISHIDKDPNVFLVQDEGIEWFQHDTEVQDKASNDTEPVIQDVTPTEVILSTAKVNTSTAGRVYSRRSKETMKDKGKAIMSEPEPKKKSKKLLEQERLGFETAIRLQEQADIKERAQIARDEEIAKQWAEQERKRFEYEVVSTKGNYKMKDFKGMRYDQIRPIFEKVWNFNQEFLAKDSEEVQKEEVKTEQIEKDSSEMSTGKRNKSLPKKRQRNKRGDGSSKNYKILSEMLEDFDRQNVEELYRLVKDRLVSEPMVIENKASLGNTSPKFSDDLTKDLLTSLAISPFYDDPYIKVIQAYVATDNELPIPPQAPITPPAILTPSLVLPPSLLFDPRYFFVPEEILPPKKQIHPPSSSSTTLSNSSHKQACILVPPSFSTYTPTPSQIRKKFYQDTCKTP